jgi:hypothetical protein
VSTSALEVAHEVADAADPGLLWRRTGRSLADAREVLSIHSSDLMHGLHLGVEKNRLASRVILSVSMGPSTLAECYSPSVWRAARCGCVVYEGRCVERSGRGRLLADRGHPPLEVAGGTTAVEAV